MSSFVFILFFTDFDSFEGCFSVTKCLKWHWPFGICKWAMLIRSWVQSSWFPLGGAIYGNNRVFCCLMMSCYSQPVVLYTVFSDVVFSMAFLMLMEWVRLVSHDCKRQYSLYIVSYVLVFTECPSRPFH